MNKIEKSVTLPDDDAFLKDMKVQWWYWTGHLEDENKHKYGFEVVFFTFNSFIIFKNCLSQIAITDLSENKYIFREKTDFFTLPKYYDNEFLLNSKGDHMKLHVRGGNGCDKIHFKLFNYELILNLNEIYSPTIHYEGKCHNYSFGGNSFYYSRENMKTSGTLIKNGQVHNVSGLSWFDRQYGDLYQGIFKGWQWFSIRLHNGEKIMLYDYLKKEYSKERFGSISKEYSSTELKSTDFTVKALTYWRSPNTRINYPASWEISILDKVYKVFPYINNQELCATDLVWIGPEYWEGSCRVKDSNDNYIGDAYVELNGYSKHKIITFNIFKRKSKDYPVPEISFEKLSE